MKRTLIIIGLILLFGISYAQKGLFDIEFGAPIADTETMLKAKGFVETSRAGSRINYSAEQIPALLMLELQLNSDSTEISGWKLQFDLSDNPKTEADIMDQLIEAHGESQVKDDYDFDYVWYFDEGNALYVSTDQDNRMLLNYTTGNWDDDDWYYYGWF